MTQTKKIARNVICLLFIVSLFSAIGSASCAEYSPSVGKNYTWTVYGVGEDNTWHYGPGGTYIGKNSVIEMKIIDEGDSILADVNVTKTIVGDVRLGEFDLGTTELGNMNVTNTGFANIPYFLPTDGEWKDMIADETGVKLESVSLTENGDIVTANIDDVQAETGGRTEGVVKYDTSTGAMVTINLNGYEIRSGTGSSGGIPGYPAGLFTLLTVAGIAFMFARTKRNNIRR